MPGTSRVTGPTVLPCKTDIAELLSDVWVRIWRLGALPDDWIDVTDASEIHDGSNVLRGVFHRPVKQQDTLSFDAGIIAWLRPAHVMVASTGRTSMRYAAMAEGRPVPSEKPD